MNLKQAAHHLSVHYQTAYRWVRDGQLAAVKIGNRYEVSEAAIEQFLSRRTSLTSVPLESSDRAAPSTGLTSGSMSELAVLCQKTRMTAQPCFDAATAIAGSVVGDASVLRLLDESGESLVALSSFAESAQIRSSVVGAVAAAGSFPRSAAHWSAAEHSGAVHVVHHMPRDSMHELFGEEGRFAGHGVPVLAAAVAPIYVRGDYVGGLLATKSLSYEPFGEADTSLLSEVAKLCGTSHARAIEFRRAWDSNAELNELLAASADDGEALQRAVRADDLLIVDRPHALMAPDRTILASSPAFDAVLAASCDENERVGALDRIVGDSRVSEVVAGSAARVDVAPLGNQPGAIVSAVRGSDATLRALVMDLILT